MGLVEVIWPLIPLILLGIVAVLVVIGAVIGAVVTAVALVQESQHRAGNRTGSRRGTTLRGPHRTVPDHGGGRAPRGQSVWRGQTTLAYLSVLEGEGECEAARRGQEPKQDSHGSPWAEGEVA